MLLTRINCIYRLNTVNILGKQHVRVPIVVIIVKASTRNTNVRVAATLV